MNVRSEKRTVIIFCVIEADSEERKCAVDVPMEEFVHVLGIV